MILTSGLCKLSVTSFNTQPSIKQNKTDITVPWLLTDGTVHGDVLPEMIFLPRVRTSQKELRSSILV